MSHHYSKLYDFSENISISLIIRFPSALFNQHPCPPPQSVTAHATKGVKFWKYQGLGNDFILVDNRHQAEPMLTPEQAVKLCDRNFGIGGDGVIFALPPVNGTDYTMRIYNSDGSEPEMCGNGIRCLARFVADIDKAPAKEYKVHTLAGLIKPTLQADGQVCVDMGEPILTAEKVPTTIPANSGAFRESLSARCHPPTRSICPLKLCL